MFRFTIRDVLWFAFIGLGIVGMIVVGVRDGTFAEAAQWFRDNGPP
jgi:hypothetical protein